MGGLTQTPRESAGTDLVHTTARPRPHEAAITAVSHVRDEPTSLDSIGFGVLLGLPAAILTAVLIVRTSPGLGTGTVAAALILLWPVAAWLLFRGTRSVVRVLRRGCGMGALLWTALAQAPHIDAPTVRPGEFGLSEMLAGRLATGMALLCAASFVALLLLGRAVTRPRNLPVLPVSDDATG